MERGITKVTYVRNSGTSPAAVSRKTGECFINLNVFEKLPQTSKLFVLLHENAHVKLNTTNEYLADKQAFEDYVKLGYSLKGSVKALSGVLNNNNPEHVNRTQEQLKRGLSYDYYTNNNTKALNTMQGLENTKLGGSYNYEENFLGLGKRARERKEERSQMRLDERQAKIDRKAKIADAKAGAIAEGKSFGWSAGVGQALQGVGNAVGGILGKKADAMGSLLGGSTDGGQAVASPQPNNTAKYALIGGAVLVVLIVAFLLLKKRK